MGASQKTTTEDQVKEFYTCRSETNWEKRYHSPHPLRRYLHRTIWETIIDLAQTPTLILDTGCGDGVLSVLMAEQHPHQRVVAMDISHEAVQRTQVSAAERGMSDRVWCVVGDAENLPFRDGVFPLVISSHVLEHLPSFSLGVTELKRVTSHQVIIATPTCLNPSAMALLGGDSYWMLSRRTPWRFPVGALKILMAWILRREGVQEGYAGHHEVPHLWRFPWRVLKAVVQHGLVVEKVMADSLLIPYVAQYWRRFLGIQQWLDRKLRERWPWRNLGVGIILVARKNE